MLKPWGQQVYGAVVYLMHELLSKISFKKKSEAGIFYLNLKATV